MATPNSSQGESSTGFTWKKITQRYLERKVLHAKYAHLSRTLRASEIMADLYSAGAITSNELEMVDAATTSQEKNEIILRGLKRCEYSITPLCEALDRCASLRYVAADLRKAVEEKKRKYDEKSGGRHNVSTQQLQVCKKSLSNAGKQFGLLITELARILDRYPEVLEDIKTALITVTVLVGNEKVVAVIEDRKFTEASSASHLFRALAPVIGILDENTLETLVEASQVDEAIERFEAYQRARDTTVPLVVFESNTPHFLHPPPASSEADAVGARELVVRISRENLTRGDVAEMRADISGALNLPLLAVSPQGVIQSSVSVMFWVSEKIVPYIQLQLIFLASLRFLHEEGIVDIRIESDYLLTTPSALCLEFWEACKDGDVEAVLSCLSAGVGVDVVMPPQSASGTGLIVAAQYGRDEMVHLLVSSGANPNVQTTEGVTALMYAALNGHTETAEVLLKGGADVHVQNKEGATALMFAAQDGHTETAEVLLKGGADVHVQNKKGTTALMFAAESGHTETVEVLLKEGADVHVQSKEGVTALMVAAQNGHTETAEVLLKGGADVHVQNKNGTTALMFAALNGHTETAEVLLKEGADVHVQDKEGYTALHWAAQNRHTAVVSSLLRASADPNSVASWQGGSTPLMAASWMGNVETVDLLLCSGANINQTNEDGMTALMHAAAKGHVNVLTMLIKNKADVNILTKDGVSALDMAKENNFPEVCELLQKHGAKPGGPGSQEKAKSGLAKLWARFKKTLKALDIGGVQERQKQKLEAKDTPPPLTHISH